MAYDLCFYPLYTIYAVVIVTLCRYMWSRKNKNTINIIIIKLQDLDVANAYVITSWEMLLKVFIFL